MFSLTEMENEIEKDNNNIAEKEKLELDKFLKLTIRNLDENQLNILNSDKDRILVFGPAGSGKSMLALRKVLDLHNNKKNFRIILYTKALTKYLIGKLKRVNLKELEAFILCGEEFKRNDLKGRVDYIVIDEVQDFNISEIDICCDFVKDGYFLFGDSRQQIYPNRTENEDIIGILKENDDISFFELPITYRFPRKIALFCEQIKDKSDNLAERCLDEGGEENIPKLIEFKNIDQEMDYIYNAITNEGWKDVGILVRRNDMVDSVYRKLKARGLICDYKNEKVEKLDFSNNRPKILTYHSSKGLEFERVFIPECNVYEDESTNYNYREALYVACTRAAKTLVVSYTVKNKSPYLDGINKSYYKFERR